MDKKYEKEADVFLHKKGNPLCETTCYQIGGTVYEVTTSCGGAERLYDKMVRLIKSETITTAADKENKERYNKHSNQFVGRSLEEE